MAVTINASTTAGLVQTADTSGELALQTAGTTAVTVDASQNVGIGTTTPTLYSGYTTLQVNNTSTSKGVVAVGPATTGGYLYSDGGQTSLVSLGATPLTLGTNSVERMRILTTGNILSLAGGSTSANGTGITFPATQSASTDVNTLDDYEEGSWTPTVTATAGSITTVSTGGQYRKIGSLVVLQFQYAISNNGTGINAINVSNLPFAGAVNTSAGAIREIAVAGVTGSCYLSSTTNLLLVTYNNGYPGGTSWSVVGTVCYQTT